LTVDDAADDDDGDDDDAADDAADDDEDGMDVAPTVTAALTLDFDLIILLKGEYVEIRVTVAVVVVITEALVVVTADIDDAVITGDGAINDAGAMSTTRGAAAFLDFSILLKGE